MINGIKPLPPKNDYKTGVENLLKGIQTSYHNWSKHTHARDLELDIKPGRKFDKIVERNRVWGFVAKVDGQHKGLPMKCGDVFKAAGYNAAAKHTRGNIFDKNQDYYSWTGPNYL
jgi:hypothetical protein|tara:strand:+ start:3665 stop:4009 length:345 start_codon:yes stop_codon:yes gene_type:complete